MNGLFRVQLLIKRHYDEAEEGRIYPSLLVVAANPERAKDIAVEYFKAEGFSEKEIDILDVKELDMESERVIGVYIG
ncbi:hypothetical protein NF865_05965 [Thermococcus aggregans]|uniref:Uncharacterized protein n=1 Tax=Thermococcus aggregans TaxID=110163 RepID=A0A9E7SMT1_THEAG|nr:hypothetical protein [Thermococcus aggregans]USS39911.1 hypothetical protein NF865_05965 [Thermococcus aggregans]